MPIVTHLHGAAGVGDESDGYAEAWYLPDAGNIPAGYATEGTWYDFFAAKAASKFGVTGGPGFAIFQYPNDQRESTLWYHDHALGMTRLNVYAGPAGFYLVRGGPEGRHHWTLHPRYRRVADLEPGVLRQHDHGQREHLAVPAGRAATLPPAVPERVPVALPDP